MGQNKRTKCTFFRESEPGSERYDGAKCTFFRESEPRLERCDGANNGESNGGTSREDVGQVPTRNRSEPLPWKIMYQNIRRLVTKNKKEKVYFLEDYTKQDKILIMNFTETWLNETTQGDPK